MSTSMTIPPTNQPPLAAIQQQFVDTILPAVEKHAKFAFRFLTTGRDREDAIAETVAVAWACFRRLCERGKDARKFPTILAGFAAKHVKAGRRLCGQESITDVLSPTAKRRRGFQVERLAEHGPASDPHWREALIDNRQTPVDQAVAFRCDFPEWLATLSDRDRRAVEDLALGHRTSLVAQKYGISPARVSQLRRECSDDWKEYHGQAA